MIYSVLTLGDRTIVSTELCIPSLNRSTTKIDSQQNRIQVRIKAKVQIINFISHPDALNLIQCYRYCCPVTSESANEISKDHHFKHSRKS